MTIPAWTSSAPLRLLLDTVDKEIEDNRYKFKPKIGPSITRRASSKRSDKLKGSVLWTPTQYLAAMTFYTTTLVDGTLPFTNPDPFTGITTSYKFVNPPRITSLGPKHKVSIDLEEV